MSDSNSAPPGPRNKSLKPRAGVVRKSKAERDAHAKQEAEKTAARAAAAAAAATDKLTQSSKSGQSKKNKETSKDKRDNSKSVASSIFSANSGTKSGRRKALIDTGYSEVVEGQEGILPQDNAVPQGQDRGNEAQNHEDAGKKEVSTNSRRFASDMQNTMAVASDDESHEARRDIEEIWISGEEDLKDITAQSGKGKSRLQDSTRRLKHSRGMRPTRAPKYTVEDDYDDKAQVNQKIGRSAPMELDDADAQDEGGSMEIEEGHPISSANIRHDMPSSPELSRRTKPGRKAGTKAKDNKVAAETVEEQAERHRLLKDIEKIKKLFVPIADPSNGDEMERDEIQKLEEKLFLFQFPPLVPFLAEEGTTTTPDPGRKQKAVENVPQIKADPDDIESAMMVTQKDDSSSVAILPEKRMESMLTAIEPNRLPPGRVGKLRIHKSGKVTLDWGGTDMEVRYGTEVNFLQDAILIETPKDAGGNDEKSCASATGFTYALGQVRKKMIVIPDWQKLYD